jgi:CRISPR-associated protein Cas4
MYYDYIQISKINDFIFCPHSIYFHNVYEEFESVNYKSKPQIAGGIAHENIDQVEYSSLKNVLQGMEVFSHKLGLIGKIDVYDKDKKELVERKRLIKKIYDGYVFQLLAQKSCLEEMGFIVDKIFIHSLSDNKRVEVVPSPQKIKDFYATLDDMRSFDPLLISKNNNFEKCKNCIYRELCKKL